jgi:hypothetical protein
MLDRFVRTPLITGLAALALLGAWAGPAEAGTRRQDKKFDPFERPKKVDKKPVAVETKMLPPVQVAPPALDERVSRCKQSQYSTMSFAVSGETSPCPFLVSEMVVTGVFTEAGGGKGAFVLATPTKETLIVREGDKLFNGSIDEIRMGANGAAAGIVFTQRIQMRDSKGVHDVESKIVREINVPAPGK